MSNSEQNKLLPLANVASFANEAKRVGLYSTSQATNLKFALQLAVQESGAAESSETVGDFLPKIPIVLDRYGGKNAASAGTIATYKARATRLLRDFIAWHGGDFMAWKAKAAKRASAPKKRAKVAAPPIESEQPALADQGGVRFHDLRAPGNRVAKLTLPEPLSMRDIHVIWNQLDRLRPYLESQTEVEDDEDEDGADGE